MKPLAVDLFCGVGGWSEGLIAEGYDVVGYDTERHEYGAHRYPGELILQDVRQLHGSELADAALIVASPPCTEYSYMHMPWGRSRQIAAALRGEGEFPEDYSGSRTIDELTELFRACFRLQDEASKAARRPVPMIVENVVGAQAWVGRARWHHGSFYLWGDVPALMPITLPGIGRKDDGGSWFKVGHAQAQQGRNPDGRTVPEDVTAKRTGQDWSRYRKTGEKSPQWNAGGSRLSDGVKQPGIGGMRANGRGDAWFQDGAARWGSKSAQRKEAAAIIAKIPPALSRHIGRVYHPGRAA